MLEPTDAKNKLEDLSGVPIQPGENPYQALIKACNDDAVCSILCNFFLSFFRLLYIIIFSSNHIL